MACHFRQPSKKPIICTIVSNPNTLFFQARRAQCLSFLSCPYHNVAYNTTDYTMKEWRLLCDSSNVMLLKTSKGDISTHTPQNWFILLKGMECKTSLNLTTRKRNEMAKKTQGRHRFLLFQAREGALGPNKQTKVIPRLTVNAGKTILQGILEQRKLTLQKSIYKDCA